MDPRITRTRQALGAAILEQIQRKRWEKITVQDLLDATGISRSTFYSHYDNKLSVLTDNIPTTTGLIVVDEDGLVDLLPLFAHVDEMAPLLHPLMSQPVLREINDEFERQFTMLFTECVGNSGSRLPSFLAGALIAMVRIYAAEKKRVPPEVISKEVSAYANRMLSAPRLQLGRGYGDFTVGEV